MKALPEYTHSELLRMEKEVTGLYLSGHPLTPIGRQSAAFPPTASRC